MSSKILLCEMNDGKKKAVSLHEKNTTHFCLNLQEHYMWFRIHVVAFFYHTSPGRTNHRVCFHTLQCPHNRNTAWKLSSSLIKEKINVNMSLFFYSHMWISIWRKSFNYKAGDLTQPLGFAWTWSTCLTGLPVVHICLLLDMSDTL